MTDQFFMA